MSRATPGPWHVAKHVRHTGARLVRGPGKPPQLIAEVVQSDSEFGADANANLTAAAPDMLAALEKIATGLEDLAIDAGDLASRLRSAAEEAVAKARGES